MNCKKCGHPLDTGLKCWYCGAQYELCITEGTTDATYINSNDLETTSPNVIFYQKINDVKVSELIINIEPNYV